MRMYVSEHLTSVTLVRSRMPAVTGLSRKVYDLLVARPVLSLEIKSAHNIHALSSAQKGSRIFLTPILREDLLAKTGGLVCEICEKNVSLQKMKNWDEVEIVAVRIQVRPLYVGRVRAVEKKGLDEGVEVEVEGTIKCSIS